MKRTRLAAVPLGIPLGLFGIAATGGAAQAADDQPSPEPTQEVQEAQPLDATAAAAPVVAWRPIPRGLSTRDEDLLDVPGRALAAYQRAAVVMEEAAPDCHLTAPLLAAIGKVESDHGRLGAWKLGPRARMFPALIGTPVARPSRHLPPLPDTDGGTWDHDPDADHPLGPLQLLPSLWQRIAVDGDGDGLRSPYDLDDAALALGVALCNKHADLADWQDRRAALRTQNDRPRYVHEVEAFRRAYAAPVALPPVSITTIGIVITPPPAPDEANQEPAAKPPA